MGDTEKSVFEDSIEKKANLLKLGGNPIDIIEYEHKLQKRLCGFLESIADGLPNMVDPELCKFSLTSLKKDLPVHILDEEQGLFPLLEKRAHPDDNIEQILSCLAMEHATDESFAYELEDSLHLLSNGKTVPNPNMTGYMLRSFFECYKRHLIWENVVVIPLARKRLNQDDLNILSIKMIETRKDKC